MMRVLLLTRTSQGASEAACQLRPSQGGTRPLMNDVVVNQAYIRQRVSGQQRYATEVVERLERYVAADRARPDKGWAHSSLSAPGCGFSSRCRSSRAVESCSR